MLSGLSPAQTYEVQVRANCTSNNSTYSSSVQFTTETPVCATLIIYRSSNIQSSQADLSWNGAGTSYTVRYRATGSTSWTSINTTAKNKTLNGLSPVTEYEFQVKSICQFNDSGYSSTYTFSTIEPGL